MIDEGNYDAAALIEVKIPLRLHYYSSSLHYERYYGEAEVSGTYYSYVMRKVINDTVYLLCLPNTSKSALEKARTQVMFSVADIGGAGDPVKGKSGEGKKIAGVTDLYLNSTVYQLDVCMSNKTINPGHIAGIVIAGFERRIEPPPQKMITDAIHQFYSTGVMHRSDQLS